MKEPAIPSPAQIRRMPVDSVRALSEALVRAGLTVRPGGTHLRVETAGGLLLGILPHTPSDPRSLLNTRSGLARRAGEMQARRRQRSGTNS